MTKHLQKIVDFAVRGGYTIKFSPARRSARFRNKKLGVDVNTRLYQDKVDGGIWVWFEVNGGMSGNDPENCFLDTFKRFHRYP